jgi:hypothetical protein
LAYSKKLKGKDTLRHQRGDVLLHTGKDKKEVRMSSTRYTGTIGEGTNTSGERIRKATSVMQYKFLKGVDRADRCL